MYNLSRSSCVTTSPSLVIVLNLGACWALTLPQSISCHAWAQLFWHCVYFTVFIAFLFSSPVVINLFACCHQRNWFPFSFFIFYISAPVCLSVCLFASLSLSLSHSLSLSLSPPSLSDKFRQNVQMTRRQHLDALRPDLYSPLIPDHIVLSGECDDATPIWCDVIPFILLNNSWPHIFRGSINILNHRRIIRS